MKMLRTPDACFDDLIDFDFEPHYTEIADADGTTIRIHHVEAGPEDAAPVLLIHGNPTWSYLHRRFLEPIAAAGHRAIAVDLVGCGRSDKPAEKSDYTQARHVDWMTRWLESMDLRRTTLFCQDWGGTIGLHLVAHQGDRFDRVVVANSGLPLGQGEGEFMKMWTSMMREATSFPFDQMLPTGVARGLEPHELAAYKAPFPDDTYMAGICEFPMLIAVQPDNPGVPANRAVWKKLGRFEKPFLTLFGGMDPVTQGGEKALLAHVPGARGQAHHVFQDASHFIQEDVPGELVERTLAFIEATQ